MTGLTYSEQMRWRRELETAIRDRTDRNIIFVHPPLYYQRGDDEREAMEWDINQVLDCDIMVVDLRNIQKSIGTHMELGIAQATNRVSSKNINIVGIGSPEESMIHPWIDMSVVRKDSATDAAEYIVNYLLL